MAVEPVLGTGLYTKISCLGLISGKDSWASEDSDILGKFELIRGVFAVSLVGSDDEIVVDVDIVVDDLDAVEVVLVSFVDSAGHGNDEDLVVAGREVEISSPMT